MATKTKTKDDVKEQEQPKPPVKHVSMTVHPHQHNPPEGVFSFEYLESYRFPMLYADGYRLKEAFHLGVDKGGHSMMYVWTLKEEE